MPEEKTNRDSSQGVQPKRIIHLIVIAPIVVLLILSISSLFLIVRSRSKGSQLATITEMPTPSPTSIYLETPPAQSEFYDTFKNNAQDWSISNTEGYYRTVKPGELTLMNTNSGTTMIESLPTNLIFDNCTVTVDLTVLKAKLDDSVGMYVRGDTDLEHDYRVDLNGNGTFDIAKEYLDSGNNPQSVILLGPKSDSALHPQGEHNTITLAMNGSRLQLSVNNVKVGVVTDNDYAAGQVALFAHLGEGSQAVSASFGRVEIDKLPDN